MVFYYSEVTKPKFAQNKNKIPAFKRNLHFGKNLYNIKFIQIFLTLKTPQVVL